MKEKTLTIGPTLKGRLAFGKALREKAPRGSHAKWAPDAHRENPVTLIERTDRGRIPELLPVRYGRMRVSPFAFYRGTAAIMAADLARTPVTPLRVQACGDCHLANFGGFGSPERRLVFDINDFDETHRAPWEWDVKRLMASVILAGRELGIREKDCREVAQSTAKSYRLHMHGYARLTALGAWYSHLDAKVLIDDATSAGSRRYWKKVEREAYGNTSERMLGHITKIVKGLPRIVDHPPIVYHPAEMARIDKHVREMFARYLQTLPEERRVALRRYKIVDIARKVVGVGSVGTRCDIALLMAGPDDPLFLQFKEARPSVLEPYASKSPYKNQGERVVTGQRILQSESDVFLGWTHDDNGHDYYFRQLRDMRMEIDLSQMPREIFYEYVALCGWSLARAHSRSCDPAHIAGYLGNSGRFDEAMAKFAVKYADQTERDYEIFVKAIRTKRLRAQSS